MSTGRAPRSRRLPALLTICLVIAAPAFALDSQGTPKKTLTKVAFNGLHRYTDAQVLKASGLILGQPMEVADVEAAAKRLAATGLFKSIGDRYGLTADRIEITFQLEEIAWDVPVLFDNFVGFDDVELVQAIGRDVPSFDGTAPQTGRVLESIKRVLQSLVAVRGIQGSVEYAPSLNRALRYRSHVYSVRGARLPICTVSFPAASAVPENELRQASKPLTGADYSRLYLADYADHNLLPLYRRLGYLQARLGTPGATPETSAGCAGGVAVSLPLEQGIAYTFGGVEWIGARTIGAENLDRLLGLKPDEIADGVKLDAGLAAVREELGRRGLLDAELDIQPAYDDAGHRVTYRMTVEEGAQYRMGALEIAGLSEDDAAKVRKEWKLTGGAVFDATYLGEFLNGPFRRALKSASAARTLTASVKPDPAKTIVDVSIEVK